MQPRDEVAWRIGLPSDQPALEPKLRSASLVVAPTSGFNPRGPPLPASLNPKVRECGSPAPLVEFVPLRRLSPGESTPPRFATTGYVPSSGFRTLSTDYSSPERPVLFHTGNVLGVRSSGVSPRRQVPQLVIAELPSWHSSSAVPIVMMALRRRAWQTYRWSTRAITRLQGVAPTVNPYRS
jgi:hypothetical protein